MATPMIPPNVNPNTLSNLIADDQNIIQLTNLVADQPFIERKTMTMSPPTTAITRPQTHEVTEVEAITEYIEKEQIIQGKSTWSKLPPMVTSNRVAPPPEPEPLERTRCGGCPPWLLGLLLLLSLLGLTLALSSAKAHTNQLICREGQYVQNGKCLSCPADHYWNGKKCIREQHPAQQPSQPKPIETVNTSVTTTLSTNQSTQLTSNLNSPKTEQVSTSANIPTSNGIPESGVKPSASTPTSSPNQPPPKVIQKKIFVTSQGCQIGFFYLKGQCLRCPDGTNWNGTDCIRKLKKKPKLQVVQSKSQIKTTNIPNTSTVSIPSQDYQNSKISQPPSNLTDSKISTIVTKTTKTTSQTKVTRAQGAQQPAQGKPQNTKSETRMSKVTEQTPISDTNKDNKMPNTGQGSNSVDLETKKKSLDKSMTVVIEDKPKIEREIPTTTKQTVSVASQKQSQQPQPPSTLSAVKSIRSKVPYGTVVLTHFVPSI